MSQFVFFVVSTDMKYSNLISSCTAVIIAGYSLAFAAWDTTITLPAVTPSTVPTTASTTWSVVPKATTWYNPSTDVSVGAWVNKTIKHPRYRESQSSYDLYMSGGVYLFILNTGLNTIRNPNGTNARKLQTDLQYDLVLNGWYFTYEWSTNSFLPAWRIVDGTKVMRSMVKEFFHKSLDVNLALTVIYDKLTNKVAVSRDDLVLPRANIFAFYAGPELIQWGQVMTGINANLSHRQRKAVRTFMIIDMDGKPHLGMTNTWYTLPELAQKIKDMKVFYGSYQVINLDGGSSTSLAAGSRYWNSSARLPWFFGVKK